MAAIKSQGLSFQYADNSLKCDLQFILKLLEYDLELFLFIGTCLRNIPRSVALKIFDHNSECEASRKYPFYSRFYDSAYREILKDFHQDKEIILKAILNDPSLLKYAHEDLKQDRTFILDAVRRSGLALQFADDSLKKDREIVLEAVRSSGWALQWASDELKADKEVVLAAVTGCGQSLKYASHDLKDDKDVVIAAVSSDGSAIMYASLRNVSQNDKHRQ